MVEPLVARFRPRCWSQSVIRLHLPLEVWDLSARLSDVDIDLPERAGAALDLPVDVGRKCPWFRLGPITKRDDPIWCPPGRPSGRRSSPEVTDGDVTGLAATGAEARPVMVALRQGMWP